jgi:hypothetical protein
LTDARPSPELPIEADMRRQFPRWFNWTAGIVIALCVLGYLAFREQRAAGKLIEIRTAIDEYAAHVQSLEGKYSSSHVSNPPGSAGSRTGQTAQHESDFAFDLRNSRMALESRELVQFADMPGVTFRFRRVTMRGGGTSYLLMYSRRAPQNDEDDWGDPHILIIGAGDSYMRGPWDLAGLKCSEMGLAAGAGLAKLFAQGDLYGKVRYEGMEAVNGGMCERVSIIFDGEPRTFWLDPAHDYLPRRQNLKSTVLDVFEFQQFRDEAGGGMHWFPSRGTIHWTGVTESEFVITQLRMNPSLDITRFQIDPASLSDGVKVDNRSKGTTTFTGDREDLWKERDNEHEEGMRILRARVSPEAPSVLRSGP